MVENDEAAASWDADSNSFIVKCPKKNSGIHTLFWLVDTNILSSDWSGEQFNGLEMLTDLLTPKGEQNIKQNIEVVSEDNENEDVDEEEIDFYFEQTLPEEESSEVSVDEDGYGFAFQKQNVYSKLLAGKLPNFLIGWHKLY